jgi:hypothetical protein
MSNAFTSMGYPHWLVVAGATLLLLGLIGLAFRHWVAEPPLEQKTTSPDRPWLSEAELAQVEVVDRKAGLADRAKERWAKADKKPPSEEPLNQDV